MSLRAVMIRSVWHKGWNLDGGSERLAEQRKEKGRLRGSAPSDSALVTLLGHSQQWGPEPGLLHPRKAPKPYL